MTKKILITGSSGYVGQHLIASICSGGLDSGGGAGAAVSDQRFDLFCAYNSLPSFEGDLAELVKASPLHPSVGSITPIPNIDFSQPGYVDVIREACVGDGATIDAIIHLAALSSPGYCEGNADVAWRVNCPVDLLQLDAPIIYMSTDQVYEGTKQFYREDGDPTLPVNVYGRTKLAFERVLLNTWEDGTSLLTEEELGGDAMPEGIKPTGTSAPTSVILRSSLILGPPTPLRNGCKKGAFPSFLQFVESRVKSSTPTEYYINEFRSVVYVEDVIKALTHFLMKALSSDASLADDEAQVFNLGGSTRVSRYDLALEVAKHLKLDSSTAKGVDRPDTGGGVPSPPDISMNVEKITQELGLPKMAGLKDIISATFK